MIPLFRPLLPNMKRALELWEPAVISGQVTNFGPCYAEAVKRLDQKYQQRSHHIVNSGTAALEIVFKTRFKPGTVIAIPDFTFVATVSAAINAGLKVLLAECQKEDWQISKEWLVEHRNSYEAFVVVCPFGHHVFTEGYDQISEELGKKIVYDFAGGWGIETKSVHPVIYSLHATKLWGIGEGGIISSFEAQECVQYKKASNFWFDEQRNPEKQTGTNAKVDELHCAMVSAGLEMKELIRKRGEDHYQLLNKYLEDLPRGLSRNVNSGWPYLCVLAGFSNAKELLTKAKQKGITLRHAYNPLMSRCFPKLQRFHEPNEFFETTLALPSDVTQTEYQRVIEFFTEHAEILPLGE